MLKCVSCGKVRDCELKECIACRDKRRLVQKRDYAKYKVWHSNHRKELIKQGVCCRCGKNKPVEPKLECVECYEKAKLRLQKVKDQVYLNYGGYVCSCCGETIREFLTIDHINNNGAEHRKVVKPGRDLYLWLKKNDYPKDFQVLCMNCNFGKFKNNGVCPHKTR